MIFILFVFSAKFCCKSRKTD